MARSRALRTVAAKLWDAVRPEVWRTRRLPTFLLLVKVALPPTIVVALALSDTVLRQAGGTNDVTAVAAIISHCLQPRGKFLKIMTLNILALGVAVLSCCLALFCCVKAGDHRNRLHDPHHANDEYDSNANAVAAIWLIVTTWIANSMRSWRPAELQSPIIVFSLFTAINVIHFGNVLTFHAGIKDIWLLVESVLIGFGIASVVSLFILPTTSRGLFFQDTRDYAQLLEAVLEEKAEFVKDTAENFSVWFAHGNLRRNQQIQNRPSDETLNEKEFPPKLHPQRQKVQATMAKMNSLFSKLQYDLLYSKGEFAIGKLRFKDLAAIEELLGSLILPISGIAMLPNILEMHIKHERHQQMKMMEDDLDEEVLRKQSELREAVETLQEHLSETAALATKGIQYFLLVLELVTPRQLEKQQRRGAAATVSKDEESGFALNPLAPYFVGRFERIMHESLRRRRHYPTKLSSLAPSELSKNSESPAELYRDLLTSGPKIRLEFFLILYMGQMQDILLLTTHDLVKFADEKAADGTMKSYRPIVPKHKSIKHWLSMLKPEDGKFREHEYIDPLYTTMSDVGHGQERSQLPDPEHLPPSNMWEKGSNVLRWVTRGLGSEHSIFGFRVAAATFCVGVLAFLRNTQDFFFRKRVIWVVTVIIISMNPTSGETFLMMMSRVLGTAVSLVLSLIVWYIVNQKFPGIVVFLYFANMAEYYFYVKHPDLLEPLVIAILSLNVTISSELVEHRVVDGLTEPAQVQKLPIYIFGPYRLLTVIVACVVMAFWTVLPYTKTSKSKVRGMLGRGLFILAQFYSLTHTSVALWMSSGLSDGIRDRESLSRLLVRKRRKIFRREMVLLDKLRNHSWYTTFEPPVGGKFPKKIYDDIIEEIQNSLSSLSLMGKTIQTMDKLLSYQEPTSPTTTSAGEPSGSQEQNIEKQEEQDTRKEKRKEQEHEQSEEPWFTQVARITLETGEFKSARLAAFLCNLSASVANNQPLPPYLNTPSTFVLSRQMQKVNKELLHVRHIGDPTFTALISLEVLRSVLGWCMKDLLRNVKKLVGELNFEYRLASTEPHGEAWCLVAGPPQENEECDPE